MPRLVMLALLALSLRAERLDLAPFARPCCGREAPRLQTLFDYAHPRGPVRAADGRWVYGLQWAEERDIFEVRIQGPCDPRAVALQYWFRNWPYPPPQAPNTEDPVDDPWQGEWVTARTEVSRECVLTFQPLDTSENKRAGNMLGVRYRRAVKLRLVSSAAIEGVQVFSETTVKPMRVRVEFLGRRGRLPHVSAHNGRVRELKPVAGGWLLEADVAEPAPAGSNDVTVIEVRGGGEAFSFAPADLEKGPIDVPDFRARISREGAAPPIGQRGQRIRERLAAEPEQTFERASREIPPLDPIERQGGPLYLPLAADASWQKFALEWGGHVFIDKRATKAYGRELERLTWAGDRISWRIGTGEKPSFRPAAADSTLATLEDHLPVAIARWSEGGIDYEEEAFATLLAGPLSPEDPARSERTPAVLMLKIGARGRPAAPVHLWIAMEPVQALTFAEGLLTAGDSRSVRAYVRLPAGAAARVEGSALHVTGTAGSATYVLVPFIPGLAPQERARVAQLDYAGERERVVAYWRAATAEAPFHVPEQRFNTFARGLLARIRISATKDPRSGLYMVPAASYRYKVYANEAAFQSQFLDLMGHHELAARYLETLVKLQGSSPFPGTYTGGQKAVYHGARVDDEYDYTASRYNLDHGTVLWTLGEHYLHTRDRAWLGGVAPSMKRAADWVIEQRKLTKVLAGGAPCPEYGLLPAGHLEDNSDWGHWFSVNAYASAGLSALARALADVRDSDAARYRKEANDYRADLRRAVLRAAAAAPVVRLRDASYVPWVPPRAHQRFRLFGPLRAAYYSRYPQNLLTTYRLSATRELLYGPLILLDTQVFGAAEPIAAWILDDWEDNTTMSEPLGLHVHGWVDEDYWFSRGGMVFQANLQNPVRAYLRRGEIAAAVRGQYNAFVSCYYPSVSIFTEEYRQWSRPSGPFYKVPDEAKFVARLREMLVLEHEGDLLLAPGTPRRWLNPGERIVVSRAPTHFGPVSYTLEAGEREVRGAVELPNRNPYRDAWLSVRLPEGKRVASIEIDGKPWKAIDAAGRIRLPKTGAPLRVGIRIA